MHVILINHYKGPVVHFNSNHSRYTLNIFQWRWLRQLVATLNDYSAFLRALSGDRRSR
jgi:hypothetical protein